MAITALVDIVTLALSFGTGPLLLLILLVEARHLRQIWSTKPTARALALLKCYLYSIALCYNVGFGACYVLTTAASVCEW